MPPSRPAPCPGARSRATTTAPSRAVPASSPSSRSRPCPARPTTPTCRTPSPSSPTAGGARRTRLKKSPSNGTTARTRNASTASQLAVARQRLEKPGELVSEKSEGTLWVGESREVTAEYHRPWETHARMEPINATVSVTPERVDVWSPTQDQSDGAPARRRPGGRGISRTSSCTPSSSAAASAATAAAPPPSRARPPSFRNSSSGP